VTIAKLVPKSKGFEVQLTNVLPPEQVLAKGNTLPIVVQVASVKVVFVPEITPNVDTKRKADNEKELIVIYFKNKRQNKTHRMCTAAK
jgi:hypothetical protein